MKGSGATYDDHHRLIGKRVADFLLVLIIELVSLGVTAEALRANIGSKSAISLQRGLVDPKFQKTRLNGLLCGIKICTNLSFVLSQSTPLTERQTDRQTGRQKSHR